MVKLVCGLVDVSLLRLLFSIPFSCFSIVLIQWHGLAWDAGRSKRSDVNSIRGLGLRLYVSPFVFLNYETLLLRS